MSFLCDAFVPLYNFQPGNVNYENTCFIAVVANLRHVLQPVMDVVCQYTWNDYIHHVRTSWDGKYSYGQGHFGQHDAAELLGEILHEDAFRSGVRLRLCRVIDECRDSCRGKRFEGPENLAMIVLPFPAIRGRYTVSSLLDDFLSPELLNELKCEHCGVVDGHGFKQYIFDKSLSGKIVFRVNRYGRGRDDRPERRSDPIELEEKIVFDNGDEYFLEAILQHEGDSASSGHYIVFLRLGGIWQCRNDNRKDEFYGARLPPYSPENVYLVVYRRLLSAEQLREAEQVAARRAAVEKAAEEQRQREYNERIRMTAEENRELSRKRFWKFKEKRTKESEWLQKKV